MRHSIAIHVTRVRVCVRRRGGGTCKRKSQRVRASRRDTGARVPRRERAHATKHRRAGNIKSPFNIFTRAGENDEVSCFLIMYPRTPEPRNSQHGVGAPPPSLPSPSPSSWKSCSLRPSSAPCFLPPPTLIFFLLFPALFFLLRAQTPSRFFLFFFLSLARSLGFLIVLSLHSTPSTLRLSFRAAIYRRDFALVASLP